MRPSGGNQSHNTESKMATASAYVLNVPQDRWEILLDPKDKTLQSDSTVAEPVKKFAHSRNAPLVVFASFEPGKITHIANGRKGASAGTDLVRLNMTLLHQLRRPIEYTDLVERMPRNTQTYLRRTLAEGGLLPPKTLAALIAVLTEIDPTLKAQLHRFSQTRAERIAAMSREEKENLALQKETLTAALQIAGIGSLEILDWSPTEAKPTSFLDGLPGARVREDGMLLTDYISLPGFEALKGSHVAAHTFVSKQDPSVSVTVIMANRLPLEEQTGADLIYYNETYRSFVLVQYKALESDSEEPEFRWKKGDQFDIELRRMDELLEELRKQPQGNNPDGFRLNENPFFLKFCSRMVFNPDDRGMFPGLYIPHGLWKTLESSNRLKGPKGGNVLTHVNVGRRLSNNEFVPLVAGSWVGTTIEQSASLETVIRKVLETGKTVTFAIKRQHPPDPTDVTVTEPLLGAGDSEQKVGVPLLASS